MDNCNIVYDEPENDPFINKLEQVQYNAASAITGAIKCISRSKLYKELGLESFESTRIVRRVYVLYKIISRLLGYLCKLMPKKSNQHITRNVNDIAKLGM